MYHTLYRNLYHRILVAVRVSMLKSSRDRQV
jgi:hypothetical protein